MNKTELEKEVRRLNSIIDKLNNEIVDRRIDMAILKRSHHALGEAHTAALAVLRKV